MSEDKILVGYEGEVTEETRVPVFHLICTGITQHGKTEELKRLTTEAQRLGYTILILDVKDKPEGEKTSSENPKTYCSLLKKLVENSSKATKAELRFWRA